MDDWAFIFGWGALNITSLCRKTSWVSMDPRRAFEHDRTCGWGPSAFTIRWINVITFIPLVLSIWLFVRTFANVDDARYWVCLSFLGLGVLSEKLQFLAHWEWYDYASSALFASCSSICYIIVIILVGLISAGEWQAIPAIVMLGLAVLWYGVIAVADAMRKE